MDKEKHSDRQKRGECVNRKSSGRWRRMVRGEKWSLNKKKGRERVEDREGDDEEREGWSHYY